VRHKLETTVFAQGWLEAQFESMLAIQTDEANKKTAEQIAEMWKTISESLDDLIQENRVLSNKLGIVLEAVREVPVFLRGAD